MAATLVDVILSIVGLFVAVWVLIFGSIGALLARSRGGSPTLGFALGLFPILGWPAIFWITRRSRRLVPADEMIDSTRRPHASATEPLRETRAPNGGADDEKPEGHYF